MCCGTKRELALDCGSVTCVENKIVQFCSCNDTKLNNYTYVNDEQVRQFTAARLSPVYPVPGLPVAQSTRYLVYRVPDRLLNRLQSILNAAAQLVYSAQMYDYVTPLLRNLQWLHASEQIEYTVWRSWIFAASTVSFHRTCRLSLLR